MIDPIEILLLLLPVAYELQGRAFLAGIEACGTLTSVEMIQRYSHAIPCLSELFNQISGSVFLAELEIEGVCVPQKGLGVIYLHFEMALALYVQDLPAAC